jgi:hypothetical protein
MENKMGNLPTQQKPVLERLAIVERASEDLYQILDSSFGQMRDHVSLIMQTIEGVMGVMKVVDPEFDTKVDTFIKNKKQERMQAKADREKQQVQMLLENNEIAPADTVVQDSVLVGRLFDPSGAVLNAGREQAPFAGFAPDAQQALLGKGIGFMYEAPNKSRFELLEIYNPVPKPAAVTPVVPAEPDVARVVATVPTPPPDVTPGTPPTTV